MSKIMAGKSELFPKPFAERGIFVRFGKTFRCRTKSRADPD
jgi:hypothetical protein